jgi:hypothetical protein
VIFRLCDPNFDRVMFSANHQPPSVATTCHGMPPMLGNDVAHILVTGTLRSLTSSHVCYVSIKIMWYLYDSWWGLIMIWYYLWYLWYHMVFSMVLCLLQTHLDFWWGHSILIGHPQKDVEKLSEKQRFTYCFSYNFTKFYYWILVVLQKKCSIYDISLNFTSPLVISSPPRSLR